MITGLREFRKKLSEHTSLVKKGQIVIITDREEPIASFLSINKLRELAKKADDITVLSQLVEAQADQNKVFLARKNEFVKEVTGYLEQTVEAKGKVPDSVEKKLKAILHATENLISNDGTLEDQRMLGMLNHKSHDPASRILDYDYYYVHREFIERVNGEIKKMTEMIMLKKSAILSKDLKILVDMVENSVIREKTEQDNETSSLTFSVLVRMAKNGKYYSSRIYTVMPYWYQRGRTENYFIERMSPLEMKIRGLKLGNKFNYKNCQFEILSIT